MPRILAVADEPFPGLPDVLQARPDVIVSCGDIPWDDLEHIVDAVNAPLLFVPGNHDPALTPAPIALLGLPTIANPHFVDPPGPRGGSNVDGRVEDVAGLRIATTPWKQLLTEERFPGRGYIPQAMSHGTLQCDNKEVSDRFYREVLGLDIIGGGRQSSYIKHPSTPWYIVVLPSRRRDSRSASP